VFDVAFDPAGLRFATASEDCSARVWGGAAHEQQACLKGHNAEVLRVSWSPDGEHLATGAPREAACAATWPLSVCGR